MSEENNNQEELFHVIIKTNRRAKERFIDISEKELEKIFLKPYNRDGNILSGGQYFKVNPDDEVIIIKTNNKYEDAKETGSEWIKRTAREKGTVYGGSASYKDVLSDAGGGKDVTDKYIKDAPKSGWRYRLYYNQWIRYIVFYILGLLSTLLVKCQSGTPPP